MRIPLPPDTLVSRQLTCVCCQEQFTVAIDKRQEAHGRSHVWHTPLPSLHQVEYPRQTDTYKRHLTPASVTLVPAPPEPATAVNTNTQPSWHHLYCPRCGSDNSNWLHLQMQRPYHWWKICLSIGLLLFIVALILAPWYTQLTQLELLRLLSLGIVGFLPHLLVASQWQKIYIAKQLTAVLSNKPLAPPTQYLHMGLAWLVCAILLPALLFIVQPVMVRIFDLAPQLTTAVAVNIKWDQALDWFFIINLVTLLSVASASALYQGQVSRIVPHIPQPIFTNLAAMRQLAIWEADRALAIGEQLKTIQWTQAQRNGRGGIDIVGLFRDPPELANGRLPNQVRAQQYFISTDPWCRLVEARIDDKMVTRPAGGPAFAMPETATRVTVTTYNSGR